MSLPETMQAMVLEKPGHPLIQKSVKLPVPSDEQVLVKIYACGVCRTDLHIVDGELPDPRLPLIPGHEIVGIVIQKGKSVHTINEGDIVGIPWMAHTCGTCAYCVAGKENLCDKATFTGYTVDGGYAGYTTAWPQFCIPVSPSEDHASTAPLLCAGLIGYRAYKKTEDARRIAIYGFGAAAHILTQIAVQQGKEIYAFTRKDDAESRYFAMELGAKWAGASGEVPPEKPDAAILFAPAGELVPEALRQVRKGGKVICGGIHMSDIPSFPYDILWEERCLCSVANLTRNDGLEFFELLAEHKVQTHITKYPLQNANQALDDLRNGRLRGAAVLVPEA